MQKLAYLILVLLWSTTPLAVKWSAEGLPFSVALAGRFVLAAALALAILLVWRRSIPRRAWPACACAGGSSAVSMLCVYWASQTVSSGLIAVLFGLMPLATAGFSWLWLRLKLSRLELLAMGIGITGLLIIFADQLSSAGITGIAVVLLAVLIQSGAAVQLKTVAAGLPPFAVNAGALTIAAVVLSLLCLWQTDLTTMVLPHKNMVAIAYLAVLGSVLGFSLYYWLIREYKPVTVSLISLITPASALWMGHSLNGEAVSASLIQGTACIMLGLAVHLAAQGRKP